MKVFLKGINSRSRKGAKRVAHFEWHPSMCKYLPCCAKRCQNVVWWIHWNLVISKRFVHKWISIITCYSIQHSVCNEPCQYPKNPKTNPNCCKFIQWNLWSFLCTYSIVLKNSIRTQKCVQQVLSDHLWSIWTSFKSMTLFYSISPWDNHSLTL